MDESPGYEKPVGPRDDEVEDAAEENGAEDVATSDTETARRLAGIGETKITEPGQGDRATDAQ